MGLDVTAYQHLTLVDPMTTKDGEPDWEEMYEANVLYAFEQTFTQSSRGMEQGKYYKYSGKTVGFRAGSYGGYNVTRDYMSLAVLSVPARVVWDHPEDFVDKPLFELINFSDCDGYIGHEACADLAVDFIEYNATIKEHLNEHNDRYGTWDEYVDKWLQAFQLASVDGCVLFH